MNASNRSLMAAAIDDQERRDFVTMMIAGQMFGIPVLRVRDVLRSPRIARIPLVQPWIAGALNLRGRIVTAIDMRRRLGLPPSDKPAEMSIVVQHGEELYSLVIDEVGEVLSFPASSIAPNPPALDPVWRAISGGVIRLEGRLLVVVEVDDLFEYADAA